MAAATELLMGTWLFRKGVRLPGVTPEAGLYSCKTGFEQTPLINVAPWLVQSAAKLPERYCVGITLLDWGDLGVLLIAPWKSVKKNSLSFTMGPPNVAPKSFHCSAARGNVDPLPLASWPTIYALALFCQVLALKSVLRKNSKMFPWNLFVPDLSDSTTTPPM